jgi:hypothetical protein
MTQYVGLCDCYGLESFISLPERVLETELAGENGTKSTNELVNMLSLRAQANRQRHAVIFRVEVDDADAQAIKWLMDGERYAEALEKLKKCATQVEVGKFPGMKKSWRLIPNPELDAWVD